MVREGIAGPYVPIPRFRDHVPLMVANLKRLELISWDRIQEHTSATELGNGQEAFQRIASTDSPSVRWLSGRICGSLVVREYRKSMSMAGSTTSSNTLRRASRHEGRSIYSAVPAD